MRKNNVVIAVLLAAGLGLAPVSAASASPDVKTAAATGSNSTNAGGGLWQYGTDSSIVFSYYHHGSKNHTATACDGSMIKTCKQVAAVPNQWARATTGKTILGGNTAFWNTL
jgi:lactococcin 972 family bacteriocin